MRGDKHVRHGYKPRQSVVAYDMSRKILEEKIPFFLKKGYVFTFTATEDNYADRIEEVEKMIAKVKL